MLGLAGGLLLEEVKGALDFATNGEVRAGLLHWNTREHRLASAAVDDRRSRLGLAVADVRGYTTVLPDRAFEIVATSYRSLDAEGSVSAVRRVQLARSETRLVAHVAGSVGDGETRRRVEQALATSRAMELDKYVGELERLLD